MLKHFFKKKKKKNKIIGQLLLAVKKKIIQEWAQRHVAYCPITLRHDKQTSHTDLREKGQHRDSCIYEPVLLYKLWLHTVDKFIAC